MSQAIQCIEERTVKRCVKKQAMFETYSEITACTEGIDYLNKLLELTIDEEHEAIEVFSLLRNNACRGQSTVRLAS